jgi:ribonuclease G
LFKEILIQESGEETIVAILEEHKLAEIYFEKNIENRLIGNIYQGKVANVLPGMQAAFVDIGLDKNAFLYVEDVLPVKPMQEERLALHAPSIGDLLKVGQTITVQIIKEPLGTKGARVTTNLTLPGRFLVLMPTVDYIGVSRRIESESERNRLKAMAQNLCRDEMGVIIRTVAQNATEAELKEDFAILFLQWQRIKNRIKVSGAPAIVHRDLDLQERILRDLLVEDIERITVNTQSIYTKASDYATVFAPSLKHKISLKENKDILIENNVYDQVDQGLRRKVWLDCGGYLIIDQVEALTVIDVNTGKYVGKTTLSDTVLKTNLQAAVEIAHQLRLRNIGGIIIIDFIDMHETIHQSQVVETLEAEFKKDKTKTHILGITQLGLVELTRKKVHQSLSHVLMKECPYCQGKARILAEDTICKKIQKQVNDNIERTLNPFILIEAHNEIITYLIAQKLEWFVDKEQQFNKKILFKSRKIIMTLSRASTLIPFGKEKIA